MDHEKINLLLGEMGIQILESISNGAKHQESIKMLSGVSLECIIGRLPVLLDLKLILSRKDQNNMIEYIITRKGRHFLTMIEGL
jgi:predicted transcriptional regulator